MGGASLVVLPRSDLPITRRAGPMELKALAEMHDGRYIAAYRPQPERPERHLHSHPTG